MSGELLVNHTAKFGIYTKQVKNLCSRIYYTYTKKDFSANPTKKSNTLKQFLGCCRRIVWMCLTIFGGWNLKGLNNSRSWPKQHHNPFPATDLFLHYGGPLISFEITTLNLNLSFILNLKLILVITCLGGRFEIKCPREFLNILKFPE